MDSDDTIQNWFPSGATIPVRYNGGSSTVTDETRCFFTRANYNAAIGTSSGTAASMTFNSVFSWDYDPSNGVSFGNYCFQSVAAHETGHALGFTSGADFRTYDIEALDIYRFQRTDGTGDYNPDTLSEFQTTARLVDWNLPNNDHNSDLISVEYQMSDGSPYQASHFRQGYVSAIMQPAFSSGSTYYPNFYRTPDINMFDAIGWNYPIGSNTPPVVSDIPDQTIAEGGSFTQINLDNYVTDAEDPDSAISWTYSGNIELIIDITNRLATISTPNLDWNGAETITFTAEDTGKLTDSDDAIFTVTPVNDLPDAPSTPSPSDGATDVSLNPTLSVYVYDIDGDTMDVSFYDESAVLIGTDTGVSSDSFASVIWSGLDFSTTYGWYAEADDGAGGISNSDTWYFTTIGTESIKFYTTLDIPLRNGGITGDYTDTYLSDNIYEGITERESGGKPSNRYSYLEHKWTIDVIGGYSSYVFYLEAYHTANSEGDDFVFAYSTDDVTYIDMATVTKTTDDDTYQTYVLPTSISGTIYIRVKDTDQTPGNRNKDTIYIDHMYIEAGGTPPPNRPPAMPGSPDPSNGATNVDINPALSVTVSDPDNDAMDVTFYDASDHSIIGTDYGVSSGGTASVTWSNLAYETSYSWYAVADDGEYTTTSDTWSFTTRSETQPGGMYVWDISWRAYGPHLDFTVTVKWDSDGDGMAEASDEIVSGAIVDATLTHISSTDFWNYNGVTGDSGTATFSRKKAASGDYEAQVTSITHSTHTYNSTLDVDNPDYYTH